ncbi:unnamed protein product [Callosobruchus maculatus]|uniref:Uncharacterized protein n=1 Tax=Callosobruchus maculatus TaxID=64391 RepID=A0A653CNT3_CALMS|nr:unnamed protein product [Callosobruchus maculatus]
MPKSKEKRSRIRSVEASDIYRMFKRLDNRLDSLEEKYKIVNRRGSKRRRVSVIRDSESESEAEHSPSPSSGEGTSDEESEGECRDRATPQLAEPVTNNSNIIQTAGTSGTSEEPRTDLDKDILSILGEEGLTKDLSADPIHADIASRWENILIGGLEEDTKKVLVDRYLPPSNCMAVTPPIMNPEVKIACSESVMRRDERISQVQHQIAAGLSAIGLALTRMLNKQEVEDNKDDIRLLSDAGRLLANVHHSESRSRRELIALNLNKELKETLEGLGEEEEEECKYNVYLSYHTTELLNEHKLNQTL